MTWCEMDYSQKQTDFPNQRLLTFTGLWPYQESSSRLFRIRFICLVFVFAILLEFHTLLTSDFKIDTIVEIMQTFLPTLSFAFVYGNMCSNSTTMRLLIDLVRYKWEKTVNEEELRSIRKYYVQTKFYTVIVTSLIYLYIVFLTFPSVIHLLLYAGGIMNSTQLITPLLTEFNLNDDLSYFSVLFLQYVVISTICTVGIGYCSMHLFFVQHACTLFDITMIKIDEPFKNSDDFNWSTTNNKHQDEHNWIVTVVKCYNEAVNFIGLIKLICERTYGIEAALAFIVVVLDFFYVLQLHDLTENISEKLKNCTYIGGTLLIIFAYTAFGQKVINHSNGVFVKCCEVPFYGLSLKTQKMLLLLIIRSMRPCNFSLKGAIVVSYENFLDLLRISSSYAMVFHNM